MEQVWNFAGIDAAVSELRGHAGTFQGLNEQTEAAIAKGVGAWSGEASDMWAMENTTLHQQAEEFLQACNSYFNAIEESSHNTAAQEATNAASFG